MNQVKLNKIIEKIVKNREYSGDINANNCFTCNKKFNFFEKIFTRRHIENFPLCSKCYKLVNTEIEKAKEKEIEIRKEKIRKFEEQQRAKGLIKFKDKWVTPEVAKDWKEMEIGLKNNFSKLTPFQFEKLISKLFKNKGYKTKVTKKSRDYGVDIIAKKDNDIIVIQCKKYKKEHKVGNRDIQKILGSMWKYKANKAIIITTSYFTKPALEQAKKAPIQLWNLRKLKEEIRKYIVDKEYKEEEKKTYRDFLRENKDLLKEGRGMAVISKKWQEYKQKRERIDNLS